MEMKDQLTQESVVVTGGAGFLGRCVVEKLRARGCRHVFVPRRADYDLIRENDISRLFYDAKPDVLLHLAAVVDNPVGRGNPAACFYENVMMSVQLMEAARKQGLRKMVCLGSACSYPQHAPAPLREVDFWNGYPHESRGAHGIAKKISLVQARAYRQQYGLNAIFLIPTNLYGPDDNFDPETGYVIPSLIRKFVAAAEACKPSVRLQGDPGATRDFLFVEDAAEGLLLALERYDGSDPVNLATGEEVSLSTLAGILAGLAGFSGNVVWEAPERPGLAKRWLDTSRAARDFGFSARTCLRDGLCATLEAYRHTHTANGERRLTALSAPGG